MLTHDTIIIAGQQLNCPPDSNGKTKVINCPTIKTITNMVFKTDTIVKENTARADSYKQDLLTCGSANEVQAKQIEELKTTSKHRLWWIIGISIALLISIGLGLKDVLINLQIL